MRMTRFTVLFLSAFIFLLFLLPTAPKTGVQAHDDDLEAQTLMLREARCTQCHGPESFAAGGMDYILDTEKLIASGLIKPGLPNQSHLYEEVHKGEMPADGTAPLEDEEIELIAAWITSLDPAAAAAASSEGGEDMDADEGSGLVAWLGKFHPVVVHFPIGLILIAGFFELLSMAGGAFPFLPMQDGRTGFTTAARLCLFFGALFAIVGAWLGWMNAADHFFAANLQDELFWHRWLGSAVAALSVLTLIFSEIHHRALERGTSAGLAGMLYRVLLFAGCLIIIIVGHLGGTLVFGEGYYNF